MSNEVLTPNAAGVQSAVDKPDNIAVGMYALQRRAARSVTTGEPKISSQVINVKAQEPLPEDNTDNGNAQADPIVQEETNAETQNERDVETQMEADVLSKEVDLDSMSEQELRELADKLGSRAVARFGELTAKRKHAEEQLTALRQELAARNDKSPLDTPKIENNPFSDIDSVEKLQGKAKEIDEAIEWAEDILWNNDHMAADDAVTEVDGKEITKSQVRRVLRDAQKARKDYLPAQLSEVKAREQRSFTKQQFVEAINKELHWMSGEDNDVRKQYEILKSSPILKKATEAVPELEPYMEYMVAHAANSIYARKPIVDKQSTRINPPTLQVSTSAQGEQPETRGLKAVKDIQQRFSSSGATQDFVALRALQLSKRKN